MFDETVLQKFTAKDHFFMKILNVKLTSLREFASSRFEGETLNVVSAGCNELRDFCIAEILEEKNTALENESFSNIGVPVVTSETEIDPSSAAFTQKQREQFETIRNDLIAAAERTQAAPI